MATKEDIFTGALNLPRDERAELAQRLLESLDGDAVPEADAEDAWDQELERRAQEILDGRVKGVPVEDVRREVETLLTRIRSDSLPR